MNSTQRFVEFGDIISRLACEYRQPFIADRIDNGEYIVTDEAGNEGRGKTLEAAADDYRAKHKAVQA